MFRFMRIRMVTHGGLARCKAHCSPRELATKPGCLKFHTFRSKRMSLEFVEILPPPPLPSDDTGVPHVEGNPPPFFLHGELSFGVLHKLQNHCDTIKPDLPPVPEDKMVVEPAFQLLKAMAAVVRAALANLNLPPPLVHVGHDAVVLGTALEKFLGGSTT